MNFYKKYFYFKEVLLMIRVILTLPACEFDEGKAKMNDNDSWELPFDETDEVNKEGLDFDENFAGIKIVVSVASENGFKKINLRGVYRTFVNCGSQRAIWQGFDSHFNYYAKNIKSGITYGTQFSPLSISHAAGPRGADGVPIQILMIKCPVINLISDILLQSFTS